MDFAGLWRRYSGGLKLTLADCGGLWRNVSGMLALCPPRRTHEMCPLQFAWVQPDVRISPPEFAGGHWRNLIVRRTRDD